MSTTFLSNSNNRFSYTGTRVRARFLYLRVEGTIVDAKLSRKLTRSYSSAKL